MAAEKGNTSLDDANNHVRLMMRAEETQRGMYDSLKSNKSSLNASAGAKRCLTPYARTYNSRLD